MRQHIVRGSYVAATSIIDCSFRVLLYNRLPVFRPLLVFVVSQGIVPGALH